jgi:hypothetical protein
MVLFRSGDVEAMEKPLTLGNGRKWFNRHQNPLFW